MFDKKLFVLVFAIFLLGGCTYNYYPANRHESGLVVETPAPPMSDYLSPPTTDISSLRSLPTLNAESAEYVRNIPPGIYVPMWNRMGIGDPQNPQLADLIVAVNNKGRLLTADAPRPNDDLPWKEVKVVVYANGPDGQPRLDTNGHKITVLAPLWVATVRR